MKAITSRQNDKYKSWMKLHRKKGREQASSYLIEGPNLIEEAFKAGIRPKQIICHENFHLPSDWEASIDERYQLPDQLFSSLAQTQTPQGVMAVCNHSEVDSEPKNKGSYLLLDALQDPGNVGTLVRTAHACGLDGVYIGKGSVDLYNAKALRAAQGSHFHLPVFHTSLTEAITQFKEKNITVYGTAQDGYNVFHESQSAANGFALTIGNEGNGLSPEILEQADKTVAVPMTGGAESLNAAVAGGVLMYALRHGLRGH